MKKLSVNIILVIFLLSHTQPAHSMLTKIIQTAKRPLNKRSIVKRHTSPYLPTNAKSIADLEKHLSNLTNDHLTPLLTTEAQQKTFIANNTQAKLLIKNRYKEQQSALIHDAWLHPRLISEIKFSLQDHGINPYSINIFSSVHFYQRLHEKSYMAPAIRTLAILSEPLTQLYPHSSIGQLLENCKSHTEASMGIHSFGAVLIDDNRTFIPANLVISKQINDIFYRNDSEITQDIRFLIIHEIGHLLQCHNNTNYHLNQMIIEKPTSNKFLQIYKFLQLRSIQEIEADITCGMRNPETAKENNLYHKNKALNPYLSASTPLSFIEGTLDDQVDWSSLVVDCHKNDKE